MHAELDKYRQYATAAIQTLPGLNSLVYKCVPKRMPESEFWRLFFCHVHAVVAAASTVSQAVVQAGDDTTSSAIISVFDGDETFLKFSKAEMDGIVARDAEDDEKLAAGIRMAIAKEVVPADPAVEPTAKIDVLGKTADQVAAEIVSCLGDAPSKGCVLVLQGLSGTGKGCVPLELGPPAQVAGAAATVDAPSDGTARSRAPSSHSHHPLVAARRWPNSSSSCPKRRAGPTATSSARSLCSR